MCGICGIIRFDNTPVEESSIRSMMQTMKHRGPDDEGVYLENNLGFGFVRLSILDLSPAGHQPMFSPDGRYVVVFNGEIYNYIELRDELKNLGHVFHTGTDTEVLLAAYIEWGEGCLDRFNGMWAFAIYDRQKKSVFFARDRFGVKPFYYLQTNEYFAFCSEIVPLLSLLNKKPTPDNQTIFDFLVFNRTDQTERTFFNEIKKLQHGCKFRIELSLPPTGGIKGGKKWYDLKERVSKTAGFKSPNEYRELFSSAISLHLRSDVPVGVCLSGGLDSSSIVSVLLRDYCKSDLFTFSAVYEKGQACDETEFINEYESSLSNMIYTFPDAKALENDLKKFVKVLAEPIGGTSPYAQFKVMESVQGNVIVTLDGQGADEQLAGYHYFYGFYFKDLLKNKRFGKFVYEAIKYVKNHHSLFALKSLMFFLFSQRQKTKIRVIERGYLNKKFVENFRGSSVLSSSLYESNCLHEALLDHFEFKLEHLLKWEDLNSMCFSIEARVPFLDYRLVEKTLATSDDLKIKDGITKHLLRESMKNIIPEKIRTRMDKNGFDTPQDEWFRTPAWQTIIEEVLYSQAFRDRGLINPEVAIGQYKKHLRGKVNCASEIWKWIHLELWFREFID